MKTRAGLLIGYFNTGWSASYWARFRFFACSSRANCFAASAIGLLLLRGRFFLALVLLSFFDDFFAGSFSVLLGCRHWKKVWCDYKWRKELSTKKKGVYLFLGRLRLICFLCSSSLLADGWQACEVGHRLCFHQVCEVGHKPCISLCFHFPPELC